MKAFYFQIQPCSSKNKSIISLFLILSVFSIHAQNVEILGRAKVSVMDTVNNAKMLVVKQNDGTLATRSISSLPLPDPDTTRTLASDMNLVKLLCECPSIPPAMVNSLLDNGYSLSDLLGFGVTIPNLLDAGTTLLELLNAGATTGDLFGFGFPVDTFLFLGLTPLEIYNGGISLSNIYGTEYQGGLIFYIDHQDLFVGEGLIAATFDQPEVYEWGCWGLSPTSSSSIGSGILNTAYISLLCAELNNAAKVCLNFNSNGYSDWFLPSLDELEQMYLNLHNAGHGNFSSAPYWSSTQSTANPLTDAWYINFDTGTPFATYKDSYYMVRPVRAY